MIVTESELREQVRRPVQGAQVRIAPGARLSPAAADFVAQWGLVVQESAPPAGAPPGAPARDPEPDRRRATWDVPSQFPVVSGETPLCTACGTPVHEKADGQTQLNASHFAAKTHPRIALRGRVDSLHALVLMAEHESLATGKPQTAAGLSTLAAYCRELISAEYNERPVAEAAVGGLDLEEIHRATHDPRGVLGIDHLTIDGSASMLQQLLNMLRTQAREVEIVAFEAFPSPHHAYGASICHALNRFSSIVYFLQLRLAMNDQ